MPVLRSLRVIPIPINPIYPRQHLGHGGVKLSGNLAADAAVLEVGDDVRSL
jgi:hypothetical protein